MYTTPVGRNSAPLSRTDRRNQDRTRFIDAFEALTGFRPTSACPEALPNSFLDRTAPTPAELLSRVGDRLEPRTQNALRRQVAGLVDMGPWTYRRLLYVRGFGLFCLIDVMKALAESDRVLLTDARSARGE
jgi:hypothetical protein